MFSTFETPTRQMLTGNLLFIVCCAFYIAWWLIAFHPKHAIKGFKSGWLLIFAFVFGLLAVIRILQGSLTQGAGMRLLSRPAVGIGAVVVYVVLLFGTYMLLHRQVTSELFLIVGWAAIMLLEVNALFEWSRLSQGGAITLIVVLLLAAAVSIVCYLLYYNLGPVTGYICGLIPLSLAAVMMAVVTALAAV